MRYTPSAHQNGPAAAAQPVRLTLPALARIIAPLPCNSTARRVAAAIALLALLACEPTPVVAYQDAASPVAGQESLPGPAIMPPDRVLWVGAGSADAGGAWGSEPGDNTRLAMASSSAAADAAMPPPVFDDIARAASAGAAPATSSQWKLLPQSLLYGSYLADTKDSRMGTQAVFLNDNGQALDSTLGARVGVIRHGTPDGPAPEGTQLDVEGAAFPRLSFNGETELVACDYRFGVAETARQGPWEGRLAYYHLCSHLGDSMLLDDPDYTKVSYIRDCLILGVALRPVADVRVYSEVGYAVHVTGVAQPWEVRFGSEYVHAEPDDLHGGPFLATHCHLRQDNNFGGNVTLEAGWAWRAQGTRLLRMGLICFDGLSEQYQFYNKYEDQIGTGLWYDF